MQPHIRVSARGILRDGDAIVLNRFNDGEYYNIPGGGVEEGETARLTVKREIREETGLDVRVGGLIFVLEYEPHSCGAIHGQTHQISLYFACELIGSPDLQPPTIPDVNPDDPRITGTPVWVSIAELARINYIPHVHESLMSYFRTGRFDPVFVEEP